LKGLKKLVRKYKKLLICYSSAVISILMGWNCPFKEI